MGDDEAGAALHQLVDGLLNQLLGFGIDGRGGLVEHDDAGLVHHGPHEANELALAHGERGAALHHGVGEAAGQALHEAAGPHEVGRPPDFLVRDSVVAQRNVVADGAGEQENVLQHHPNLAAQRAQVVIVQVAAVDVDVAFLDFVEAAEQVDDAGFARPGGPHEGNGLPRLHPEADVLEHPLGLVVGKPHVLELHVAAQRVGHVVAVVGQQVLIIEQLEDALGAHQAQLQGVEAVGNLADGAEEQRIVHNKGNEGALGDGAFNLALGGVPHQQAHADGGQHLGHREVDAVVEHRADVGAGVLLVYLLKLAKLALLVVEYLHHAHAREVLLHEAVELGHGVAHVLKRLFHLFLEHVGGKEQRRNHRQAHEREAPVDVEHKGHDEHNLQHVASHGGQALAEHVGQGFDVGDVARHEHADGRAVVEAELKLQQVLVEVGANVAHDVLPQPAAVVRLQVADAGVRHQ